MTRRSTGTQRSAGFTLIEVMISITLLALVAGICYAAFHLGIRAVGKGEMAVVTSQRLRAATDVLIHQVKSAVASPALIDGDTYPYFYGDQTSMSFVTEAGQLGGGGRARVTYKYVADPPQLVLEESTYFDAETLGGALPESDEARSATILDGFKTRILVRHATAADAPMLEGSIGGSDGDDEREFGLESEQSLRYLEVEVSWSDGSGQKSYTLKSLRLATEEDEE
jgi:prepilin-type N-terminal cleavage/methylation domain-containing protein